MAINVFFFQNSADPKVVDKSSYLTSYDSGRPIPAILSPTTPLDMLGPTLEVDYHSDLLQMNYAYIPEFGRYYYIGDKTVEPGQKITLQLSCDPLYTFREAILNSSAAITRNEFIKPSQVIDNQLPIDPNEKELWSQKGNLGIKSNSSGTWWEQPLEQCSVYVRISANQKSD